MSDYIRHERSRQFLVGKFIPRVAAEPGVGFDFVRTLHSQTVLGFALDEAVGEIRCLERPPIGDVGLLYLDLLSQDLVSDLLT